MSHSGGHAVHAAAASAAVDASVSASKPHKEHDSLLFDVFPEEGVTEHELEAAILATKIHGVKWIDDFKKEELGYGVWKLTAGCVVSDSALDTETVTEAIAALHAGHGRKLVKSVKFGAFNRVS